MNAQFFIEFSLSTMMLCNCDFLDLRSEDSGSFISGTRRESCSVCLVMTDRGCICCDLMVMCHISVLREKTQLRLHSTFTNVNVPVW